MSYFSWEGAAIALLDLDAFFASVEQLDHPAWRGKPVIVGTSSKLRGVVSAASYEARAWGVHSAMPSAQAEKLIPSAIWCKPHFKRYKELSSAVMQIILDETPRVEQVSIDEAFFEITPGRFSKENPLEICQRIQARVEELGLTCSIGLSCTKALAKLASEHAKPKGLTVVPRAAIEQFIAPKPIRALSGVGSATEQKLHTLGIYSLLDLAHTSDSLLEENLGITGPALKRRACGQSSASVALYEKEDEAKSVSCDRTFVHDLTKEEEICSAILSQAMRVAKNLRKKHLQAQGVSLRLRYSDLTSRTAQAPLPYPTNISEQLYAVDISLLPSLFKVGDRVRLVGVGTHNLIQEGESIQLSLLQNDEKEETLAHISDTIQNRWGSKALQRGVEYKLDSLDAPASNDNE